MLFYKYCKFQKNTVNDIPKMRDKAEMDSR